jgi:hypothetical protein
MVWIAAASIMTGSSEGTCGSAVVMGMETTGFGCLSLSVDPRGDAPMSSATIVVLGSARARMRLISDPLLLRDSCLIFAMTCCDGGLVGVGRCEVRAGLGMPVGILETGRDALVEGMDEFRSCFGGFGTVGGVAADAAAVADCCCFFVSDKVLGGLSVFTTDARLASGDCVDGEEPAEAGLEDVGLRSELGDAFVCFVSATDKAASNDGLAAEWAPLGRVVAFAGAAFGTPDTGSVSSSAALYEGTK